MINMGVGYFFTVSYGGTLIQRATHPRIILVRHWHLLQSCLHIPTALLT